MQFTKALTAPIVADIGTGCGALAISYAHERPDAVVYATDSTSAAVGCARSNAQALGTANVEILQGSLLDPLIERNLQVDVLIANLPWVAPAIVDVMDLSGQEGWRGPRGSVQGVGRDGLDLVRMVLRAAVPHVRTGGALMVGMDEWQKSVIAEEFQADYDVEMRALPFFLILHPRPGGESRPAP